MRSDTSSQIYVLGQFYLSLYDNLLLQLQCLFGHVKHGGNWKFQYKQDRQALLKTLSTVRG